MLLVLSLMLVVATGFAAWAWFRPYAWNVDEHAGCEVVGVQVREDHGYFWVEPRLRASAGARFDLTKPIRLTTKAGTELESYGTTLGGEKGQEPDELWLLFWASKEDLKNEMNLKINGGQLVLKSSHGVPEPGTQGSAYFTSHNW